MKICERCHAANPAQARYCMQCGAALPEPHDAGATQARREPGYGVLAWSLLGSIALSLVLTLVFHLPIFILAGFLPLLWVRRK